MERGKRIIFRFAKGPNGLNDTRNGEKEINPTIAWPIIMCSILPLIIIRN